MQNEFLLFKKSVLIPLLDFAIYAKLKYCILEILLMVNLIFSHKLNVFVIRVCDLGVYNHIWLESVIISTYCDIVVSSLSHFI
jgi:hypothetical protein